jgi:hypothetical protein
MFGIGNGATARIVSAYYQELNGTVLPNYKLEYNVLRFERDN